MLRGDQLAKRSALLVVALSCLAADPPAAEAPIKIWYVDAGDTALDYRVPSSTCPVEETFRERVADLYAFEDPFVPNGIRAHTLVRIEVSKTQAGYRGEIQVRRLRDDRSGDLHGAFHEANNLSTPCA